jgi:class 3 adenylate cyclase
MPEVDFLEQIQSTQGKTIGGVAGAIVFLIVVAFVLGHLVTAPFVRLRDRMYMTATLQDDGTVDPPSLLAEVSEMQESYEMMRGELSKVKSYLPQSVLVTLYGNGGDEDEEEDEEREMRTVEKSGHAESGNGRESHSVSVEGSGRGSDSASPNSARKYQNRTPKGRERLESDRLSTRSSARSATAGPQTKGLNTATNLVAKRVTVAVFNLRGFHNFCGRSSTEEISGSHSRALESITRHISENKGVVDFFHGDRLQASFNAVSHCPGHMKRGAMTALHAVTEFSKSSTLLHASAGLSTGPAHVGNMGTSTMKRFCVIGPVVMQAALLERMTRLFPGVSILCPSSMFPELSLELLLQSVALVRLPGIAKPRVIASVEGSKKMASDEWMYQLKEGESGDPFLTINQFFDAVSEGDKDRALQLFGTLTGSSRDVPFHGEAEAMRLAEALQHAASDANTANASLLDYGLYYNKCVAPV